jgi:hypothetical protein
VASESDKTCIEFGREKLYSISDAPKEYRFIKGGELLSNLLNQNFSFRAFLSFNFDHHHPHSHYQVNVPGGFMLPEVK